MGLIVSHKCWPAPGISGGYGHFYKFRTYLAKIAGYGFVKSKEGIDIPDLNYDSFNDLNCQGYWDKLPEDILIILLIHSDCDGYIFNEHTQKLADRLKELTDKDKIITYIKEKYLKDRFEYLDQITQFIVGLERAAKRKQKVSFK